MNNYLALVTLVTLAISSASAGKTCIPSGCDKQTACTTLSKGGLINLHLLGCSSIDISPTLNILKRDHPDSLCNEPTFGEVAALGCSGAVDQLESRAHHRETLCEDFSKAGLVNLSVLGCSKTTVNPVLNIGKRNDLCSDLADSGIDASAIGCTANIKLVSSDKKRAKCMTLSKAGLVNLSLLNCSEIDLHGEYDILKKRDYCECTIQGTIKGGSPQGGPTPTWSTKKHHGSHPTGSAGSGSGSGKDNGNGGSSGSGSNGSGSGSNGSGSNGSGSNGSGSNGSGSNGSGSNGSGSNGSGSNGDGGEGECSDEGSSTSSSAASTSTGKKNHTKHHHSSASSAASSSQSSSSTKKHHSHSSSATETNTSSSATESNTSSSATGTKTSSSSATGTKTSSSSTPTGSNGTCESNPDAICKSLSEAGLINLDLLNCFKLTVDPTINVATGLLPAIESGIAGIIGIL